MCTTMMVLTTIALILRQRFSNKIKPFFNGEMMGGESIRALESTAAN
uniref:Uncharacterized protein n=1 Tax=Echeneis naucrates TaxID=173247 RepID=A0A665V959_ECHNA